MTTLEILACIGLLGGAGLAGYAFGYCEKKINDRRVKNEQ